MSNDKETSFGAKMGRFVANTLVACISICLSACVIALTLRFIAFLFSF